MDRRGVKWVRTPEAMTIHAPQPGHLFLVWRAWIAGKDRDYHRAFKKGFARWPRLKFALRFWWKKMVRSTMRILTKGHEVDLKAWQMPLALFYGWSYYTICLVAQLWSAIGRTYEAAPEDAAASSPGA
jgi:hypothetical protein